ncbi:RhoGAP-domain-containing protein [Clavulina sp. PMI_390]|nr:RhoGAP-domain-containing protein [Clavulina sp. PMI_390]
MPGQFVRALGNVYHLECFRCKDCNDVVASKFFPIEGPEGRQYPLCERDYFGRLNLICGKCDQALRGSYITACNKKYHVEHFTCSVCTTVFGAQDSYYEHKDDVYCHYHYSTRFATKCAGCNSAILKQYVEINRNSRDECWHPECYMIHKFWNIKVVSKPLAIEGSLPEGTPPYAAEEAAETHDSLREKQQKMEQKVYRIWTHLSAFEESSAACISDMLRHVSSVNYLDSIRMAEKFILHVEVLFAAIDDLEAHFALVKNKGMSHVREARMLCRKTVDLFTLLSHAGETGTTERMGMTQGLLSLVTGLAHYLKILIRIALTGALKLDRDFGRHEALISFLDKLALLASGGSNPSARRILPSSKPQSSDDPVIPSGTQGVSYGYKSLAPENAGESPFVGKTSGPNGTGSAMSTPPSDECVSCLKTVEEDCVRLGTYNRWHSSCLKCVNCGRDAMDPAAAAAIKEKEAAQSVAAANGEPAPKVSSSRRPPARVNEFLFVTDARDDEIERHPPKAICCTDHPLPQSRVGFAAVSRLEQFAFLLNVALRRLYLLLLRRNLIPMAPASSADSDTSSHTATPRASIAESDIMPMKSIHLDRKLSATARVPKRSMIVESPTGRIAQATDVQHGQQRNVSGASAASAASSTTTAVTSPPREKKLSNNAPRPVAPPLTTSPEAQWSQQSSSSSASETAISSPTPPTPLSPNSTIIRPPFARNNTQVAIVDYMPTEEDSLAGYGSPPPPAAPNGGGRTPQPRSPMDGGEFDEGITLGDIPQLLESEQAREQRRSLPRQGDRPFIAELSQLELFIVKHFALLALLRSPLRDQFDLDEVLELIEAKKSTFWNKIFKGGKDKKDIKKKGVCGNVRLNAFILCLYEVSGSFGVPIELLVERDGADSLLGASRATLRIPSFIDDVISAMKQMDMSVEGIFRKAGNIRRQKELAEAYDRDPEGVDLTTDNAVQLAALLKKFLREMPEPLLLYKLHRLFIASQSLPTDQERRRFLHLISLLLPKPNHDTMEVLFVFLKWVASFSHIDEETGSKMDLQNLALVIAPSILYAKSRDATRDESFMGNHVVSLMLQYQDDFFLVPEEMLPMLHDQEYFASCLDMPSKDALKKCETYLRLRQGRGGAPNGGMPLNGNSAPGDHRQPHHPHPQVHQQRSDPMMRGRPAPPFAEGNGGRPASSHGHSSVTGHGGSPTAMSMPDHPAHFANNNANGWTSGSPPTNGYRPPPPPQQQSTPNMRGGRLPPQDGETTATPWANQGAPWENVARSRPSSPYSSADHSRSQQGH